MTDSLYKSRDLLVGLVRDENLLLCGVKHCPKAVDLLDVPTPAYGGWLLHQGWWYCPTHRTDVDDTESGKRVTADVLDEVSEKVTSFFREMLPPYLFADTKYTMMPNMDRTAIADALNDTWSVARDGVLRIIGDVERGRNNA